MAKVKTEFSCQQCGASYAKWQGKCNACGEWNTIVEEVVQREDKRKSSGGVMVTDRSNPIEINSISGSEQERIITTDAELNRVLGSGIVPGSIILLGGEPGIGKSTLLLQLAIKLPNKRVLYVSGEESEQQIKMRAERLGIINNDCFILTETSTSNIFRHAETIEPDIIIIDSIQTVFSEQLDSTPGSISQIRECAGEFQRYGKQTSIPIFLIGHINKEGQIAGPKVLEHIVDTVLNFEGDQNYNYRILRTIKNRFGSTAELGIYEMNSGGLREVSNPSELLISEKEEPLSGVGIASMVEGARPMLIETQALVSNAVYSHSQRTATGFDLRRMNMLLAVLEKRCGFKFGMKDVFLNMAGGIRVDDPAIDLAVVAALISSYTDISIDPLYCFTGEVGLSGEIRAVSRPELRISEADKLGFKRIYVSKHSLKGIDKGKWNIEIVPLSAVYELVKELFS